MDQVGNPRSTPSKKQNPAAPRHSPDNRQMYQDFVPNPAASVRGPRHVAHEVQIPGFDDEEVRKRFKSITTDEILGLRDKTILRLLSSTAAHAGAVDQPYLEDSPPDRHAHPFAYRLSVLPAPVAEVPGSAPMRSANAPRRRPPGGPLARIRSRCADPGSSDATHDGDAPAPGWPSDLDFETLQSS
ncbi:hypothetical protein AB1L88_08930 [Tautonia sp. JC769]|uniref:hypothetical protein n=1 Tax=Tautonia sp. JC769 TaxID=3232135 RepID=UPI0034594CCF